MCLDCRLLFYSGVFVIGLIVRSNNPDLFTIDSTRPVAASPFLVG